MKDQREINIKRLRLKIEETVDPEDQKKEKELVLSTIRAAAALLEGRLTTLVAEFRRAFHLRTLKETDQSPFTISIEHTWAQIAYVSAAATMVQDSLVSGSLAKSWLNLPPLVAVVVGAAVGMILSLGWKFGVGVLSRAYSREEPRSARRKLQVITAGAFVVNFVLVFVVLLSRSPSESWIEFFVNLNSFSLTLMGITLPILAGALLALAQDLDWSHGYVVEFEQVTLRLAELNGFRVWCGDVGQETSSAPTAEPQLVV